MRLKLAGILCSVLLFVEAHVALARRTDADGRFRAAPVGRRPERALLEPGSVLAAGMRVPTGEVYGGNPAVFVRKVGPDEMQDLEDKATAISSLAAEHADEFIPYGTNYQLREQMEGAAAREKTKETK